MKSIISSEISDCIPKAVVAMASTLLALFAIGGGYPSNGGWASVSAQAQDISASVQSVQSVRNAATGANANAANAADAADAADASSAGNIANAGNAEEPGGIENVTNAGNAAGTATANEQPSSVGSEESGVVQTSGDTSAANQEIKNFKPLNGTQFRSQLTVPVSGLVYTQTPGGEALERFTRLQNLAWTLDRRLPKDRLLSISVQNTTIQDFLSLAADKLGWSVTFPDGVVYVGPVEYAGKLRTLFVLLQERIRKLPNESQSAWFQRRPFEWDEGTNPKTLLKRLAKEADIQIYGMDQVPHDIWGAGQWPALAAYQKIQLIVGQFGLTYRFDATGKKIELISLQTDKVALIRSYPAGSNGAQRIQTYQEFFPDVQFKQKDNRIYARGLAEDLDRISSSGKIADASGTNRANAANSGASGTSGASGASTAGAAQSGSAVPPLETQRITLKKVVAPLKPILDALCKQLQLELLVDWDELRAAGLAPEKVITFEANELSVDELCEELGKAASCRIERRGKTIQVLAK